MRPKSAAASTCVAQSAAEDMKHRPGAVAHAHGFRIPIPSPQSGSMKTAWEPAVSQATDLILRASLWSISRMTSECVIVNSIGVAHFGVWILPYDSNGQMDMTLALCGLQFPHLSTDIHHPFQYKHSVIHYKTQQIMPR